MSSHDPRQYSIDRYNAMVEATFAEIKRLADLKGAEYAGDNDRLDNFRRNGFDTGADYRLVWRIYAGKHWDAISQYVKDITANRPPRVRLETLEGRVDDLIVYLLLFKAMLDENASEGEPKS